MLHLLSMTAGDDDNKQQCRRDQFQVEWGQTKAQRKGDASFIQDGAEDNGCCRTEETQTTQKLRADNHGSDGENERARTHRDIEIPLILAHDAAGERDERVVSQADDVVELSAREITHAQRGAALHRAIQRAAHQAVGVAAALIYEGCSRGVCASEGAEVFDPHSAAAAARVVHEACERIVALLDEAGLDAPTLPEVGEQLQLDRDTMTRALRELSLNRAIVKVERDVALSAAAEAHARELVAAAIEAAGGAATTSVLREALGVSRKRAISILEHLDAVRFTVLDKEAGGLRSLR